MSIFRSDECFLYRAEDGIGGVRRYRELGDVYKRQPYVGVFYAVSGALALLPPGIPADDREAISEALGAPVIETTIGGSRVPGTPVPYTHLTLPTSSYG